MLRRGIIVTIPDGLRLLDLGRDGGCRRTAGTEATHFQLVGATSDERVVSFNDDAAWRQWR
jgi:hypothetical protein